MNSDKTDFKSVLVTTAVKRNQVLRTGFEPAYPSLLFYPTELSRPNREWDSNPRPIDDDFYLEKA